MKTKNILSLRFTKLAGLSVVALLVVAMSGCSRWHYFPDMWYSPAVDAQMKDRLFHHKGNMMPPENTFPYEQYIDYEINDTLGVAGLKIDGKTYHKVTAEELDFAQTTEPYTFDEIGFMDKASMLARGKNRYDIYCGPCHGISGKADGPVQKKIPHVSPLVRKQTDTPVAAEGYNVARIYLAATIGIRTMSGYASQIKEDDRWALAYYVKALQKKSLEKSASKGK